MGTDLIAISNHKLDYGDFDFDRLGREIAARLNRVGLPDEAFYATNYFRWNEIKNPRPEQFQELLNPWQCLNDEWNRESFNSDDWEKHKLYFSGPFGWELQIWPDSADFSLLPSRYWQWMGQYDSNQAEGQAYRNQYRKALAALTAGLGGNEVVYLADNGHPLEQFRDITNYAELKQALLEKMGLPRQSYQEMWQWYDERGEQHDKTSDTAYWVDNFNDLKNKFEPGQK